MNFKIVDGSDLSEHIPRFVELYNQNYTVAEITQELGISTANYNNLRRECQRNGVLKPRNKGRPIGKKKKAKRRRYAFIHKNGKHFTVRKQGIFYCTVKSYDDGLEIVKRLKECGWDKSQINRIKSEVLADG